MLSYLVQCKRGRANINPRVSKASNERMMILLNCTMCKKWEMDSLGTFTGTKRDVKNFFEKNKTKRVGNFYSKSYIEYESNDNNDDSFIEEIKYFILKCFLPWWN